MDFTLQVKIIIVSIKINLDVILNDGLHLTDIETAMNVREATSSTTSAETSSEEKVLDVEMEQLLYNDSYEDKDDIINEALRLGGATMRKEREKIRQERKQKQREIIEEMHKKRSEESNMKRLIEIKKFMINNMKATEYLYKEVIRIKRDREVLDDIRKVVIEAETVGGRMRTALSNCTVEISKKFKIDLWNKKPNTITWSIVNDPYTNY